MTANSFDARSVLSAGGRDHEIYRLDVLGDDAAALPYSLKVLLENLLRKEDGDTVTVDDVRALVASQGDGRSEEHTSELQSLMRISYAVFCLKKKHTTNND